MLVRRILKISDVKPLEKYVYLSSAGGGLCGGVVVGVVVVAAAAVGSCDAGEVVCASSSQDCGGRGDDEGASIVLPISADAEFGAEGPEEALPGWGWG